MAELPESGPYEEAMEDEPFGQYEKTAEAFDPWEYVGGPMRADHCEPQRAREDPYSHPPDREEVAPS